MELKDVIESRRSIRKFKPDPVPEEYINELLEAARLAPSGTNLQPWRFVVVTGEDTKEKIAECTPLKFAAYAPLVMVCCVDAKAAKNTGHRRAELKDAGAFAGTDLETLSPAELEKYRRPRENQEAVQAYLNLNTAIAIEHMVLRAADLGLGSCWVMIFDNTKLKEVLALPEEIYPLALLPVGYPDQNPSQRPRFSQEDIVVKRV